MANYLFLQNRTGTCAWRIWPVAEALESEGHKVLVINSPAISEEDMKAMVEWADVITFQMVANLPMLDLAKRNGVYTIFDSDDLIDEVPKKHQSFEKTQDKQYQRDFRETMRGVDIVTVSTEPLAKAYSDRAKETLVLPNYLPASWERPYLENTGRHLRLGWAGGVTHQEDLDFIAPVIKEVLEKYPHVKFVYTGGGGWTSNSPNDVVKFGEDQFKDIPLNRREFNLGCRIEVWPARLNSMMLDIALAPLDRNRFSEAKSTIKYYEYAINGWPGVYQDFLYGSVVKGQRTGLLATTQEEWLKCIEELINDGQLRRQIGQSAYRDVKDSYSFSGERRREWLDFYRRAGEKAAKSRTDHSFFVSQPRG